MLGLIGILDNLKICENEQLRKQIDFIRAKFTKEESEDEYQSDAEDETVENIKEEPIALSDHNMDSFLIKEFSINEADNDIGLSPLIPRMKEMGKKKGAQSADLNSVKILKATPRGYQLMSPGQESEYKHSYDNESPQSGSASKRKVLTERKYKVSKGKK